MIDIPIYCSSELFQFGTADNSKINKTKVGYTYMYTMTESVAVAKEADAKKGVSPTRSDNSIHRARNEPEMQLGSLRGVIGNITRNGGTPSVESIATELSGMHTAQRASALLALQQTHGNRYVQRVVAGIQAKLVVGQPGDKYEQEADRVADEVMRMPEPEVQPKPTSPLSQGPSCGDEDMEGELIQTRPVVERITPLVQRQPEEEEEEPIEELEEEPIMTKTLSNRTQQANDNLHIRLNQSRGGGQPLRESDINFMERRFELDFGSVRIHTDSNAVQMSSYLNAYAFTHGRDIYFGAGRYSPGSSGKRLLAHELTHVVQQRATGPQFNFIQRFNEHGESEQETETESHEAFWEVGNVQRVMVSCENMRIAFVMDEGTLVYELIQCDIPPGRYSADVEVSGNNLMLWYGETEGENRVTARFRFRIRRWQPNPATLFRDQRRVLLYVREHYEPPEEHEPETPECWYEMPYRQIFNSRSYNTSLFDEQSFREEILSKTISLENIGDIIIDVIAHGSASGEFSCSYGPGCLTDVCLNSPPRRGSRFAVGGHARFTCPVDINVILPLEGGLDIRMSYMGILPIADIDGQINGSILTNAHVDFNDELGVIWDQSQRNPWSFSSPIDIPANASFRVDLDTNVALALASCRIWSANWRNPIIHYVWEGGITISDDLSSIDVNPGRIEERSGESESTTSRSRSGAQQPRGGSILSSLPNLIRSIFNIDLADISMQAAPSGSRGRQEPSSHIDYDDEILDDILDKHTEGGDSVQMGATFFNDEYGNRVKLRELLSQAQDIPLEYQSSTGNYVRIVATDPPSIVGYNMHNPAETFTIYTVITRENGSMVTMFPGRPGQGGMHR